MLLTIIESSKGGFNFSYWVDQGGSVELVQVREMLKDYLTRALHSLTTMNHKIDAKANNPRMYVELDATA